MKKSLKMIISSLGIILDSLATPFVFSLLYLAFGGMIWSCENNCFEIQQLFVCLVVVALFLAYIVSFVLSNIYLSKTLYRKNKKLVIIPILLSIILTLIFLFTVFWNFNWEWQFQSYEENNTKTLSALWRVECAQEFEGYGGKYYGYDHYIHDVFYFANSIICIKYSRQNKEIMDEFIWCWVHFDTYSFGAVCLL